MLVWFSEKVYIFRKSAQRDGRIESGLCRLPLIMVSQLYQRLLDNTFPEPNLLGCFSGDSKHRCKRPLPIIFRGLTMHSNWPSNTPTLMTEWSFTL